jgi:cephalosporin hydroxylase
MCRNASCSTATIVAGKPKDSKYLGIDLRDLSSFANPSENVHVLQSDSFAQEAIRAKMKELGFGPLQLLSIDGWHSIQMVLNDFEYANLLQKGGVVFFHDISHHPGPRELIAALNPDKWLVIRQCPEDYGAGIAIKKY